MNVLSQVNQFESVEARKSDEWEIHQKHPGGGRRVGGVRGGEDGEG